MTEEEYFRKNYPDSCYGDKPLSPHWDYFQDGVEFGERQSEKKIEELERKLEQTEKDLADYQFNYPTIKELEQKNAELKLKVSLSVDCDKAEKHGELCLGYGDDEDEPCEQCKNCIKCECGYYQLGETEKDEQLTKAKELLNEFLTYYHSKEYPYQMLEILGKTEEFLKEIE